MVFPENTVANDKLGIIIEDCDVAGCGLKEVFDSKGLLAEKLGGRDANLIWLDDRAVVASVTPGGVDAGLIKDGVKWSSDRRWGQTSFIHSAILLRRKKMQVWEQSIRLAISRWGRPSRCMSQMRLTCSASKSEFPCLTTIDRTSKNSG